MFSPEPNSLDMENGFLDKVEDNAAIRMWSEKTQLEKGDSLARGYTSELWDYTCISVTRNNLQELKAIWDHWNDETKQLFNSSYGDLPYLLDIKVDEHLFRAFAQYWNPAYSCFTFGKVDLVPTIEEYTALLRCPKIQADKVYSRAVNVPTFVKKLMNVTGMSEQWVTAREKVDVFALSIYGLVIFPRALGYVDEATSNLFDRLDKRVMPVPTILAETFKSLNACRRMGEGRFIGCNLHEGDIEWRALWLLPNEILYRCGNFDWVPLLGIWGAVGYALLMVLRQYRSRQFILATQGLAGFEFSYKDNGYKKNIREITSAWDQTRRMKRLAVGPMTTPEYIEWWQDFEKRNAELEKKIEQLEEEKIHLGLDVDGKPQNSGVKRFGKKRSRLMDGKRNSERVAELERSLHQYRSRNSAMELRASLSKIEEIKGKIEELESALRSCEIRTEYLETNESCQSELHHLQSQVKNRDRIMGEAVVQIRE
ncbi:hypothetical protein Goarm_022792, partial [Gossypium armourianum]|nr:hypothetical protein [Gossypium armourianum]